MKTYEKEKQIRENQQEKTKDKYPSEKEWTKHIQTRMNKKDFNRKIVKKNHE